MNHMSEKVKKELRAAFAKLQKDVRIDFFTQEVECRFCLETRDLLQEIVSLSARLKLEIHDLIKDDAQVKKFAIRRIPAIAIGDDRDYGIRFYGIPSGYEFASLLEAIKTVSTGEIHLKPETKTFLDSLSQEVHLQVFVTPTCPYCPGAVILAQQMAFTSPKVRADMIEATEYPHLAQRYQVMGVPRTVINESTFIEGAVPEAVMIDKIKEALKTGN